MGRPMPPHSQSDSPLDEERQIIRLQEDILRVAMGRGNARDAAERICRLAEPLLPESVATVLLLNDEGLLDVFAAPNVPGEAQSRLSGLRPGPEAGSCGNAVMRQEPIFVADTLSDNRWRQLRPLALDFGIMACWSLPIRDSQDRVIGSFALSSFVHRSPSPFHVRVLETVASAVSLVLEHRHLQERVQLQARALEAISEGVLVTGADERVLFVNPAFTRITGYPLDEMRGRYCTILQGEDSDAGTKARIRAALSRGEVFHGEILNVRKDGSPFWNELTISPVRDRDGAITHFVSVQRDVTARKAAERELRIAARAFEVQEGILITDAEKRIIRVNDAFSRMTGYASEEVLGRTPAILQSGRQDRAFYQTMWDAIVRDGFWQGEIWNKRKNGEIYPELLTISAVHGEECRDVQYVGYFTDISQRKAQEEHLERMALHDELTGLPNRVSFERSVRGALEADQPLAVGILDLDGFKGINDTMGHQAGDELLQRMAEEFRRVVRKGEGMARLGGDEFGFTVQVRTAHELAAISRRLLAQVGAAARTVSGTPVTGSLGWAVAPADGKDYANLLAHADEAMYAAKASGKSTFRLYGGAVQAAAERRIRVHRDVPRAISRGDLAFFLQPQADLIAGRIDGAELLARWRGQDGRWIFPAKFMPDIEQDTHLARVMGIHVLLEAHQQRERLRTAGKDITLSLNISGRHFLLPEFLDDVAEFCPDGFGLMVEVTESIALTDMSRARKVTDALKERGFRLSMDDFGTGYSSLYYATELPFDEIKLDQNFVRNMHRDSASFAVAGSALLLAELSGKSLVAEGISTPGQASTWLRMGGRRIQGYRLSPPLPERAFLTWHDWFTPRLRDIPPVLPMEEFPLLLFTAGDKDSLVRLARMPAWDCPVGRWLEKRGPRYGELPEFREAVRIHESMHALAAQGTDRDLLARIREMQKCAAALLRAVAADYRNAATHFGAGAGQR